MEGIERIKVLSSEIKDEATLEIINHLLSRTDMNEKYLNEEKSLKQMIEFIRNEAHKKATDNMAIIKDEVVFGWAIHYWDETNEDLGITKINRPDITGQDAKQVENEPKKSEAAPVQEKEEKVENTLNKKEWVAEGQLTLF